jgi:hypothetical protein
MATAAMKALPLSKVYQLLEPGPVVLLTTAQKGHLNVMTMSWHMMVEFEPPLVACVVSGANHSLRRLAGVTHQRLVEVPHGRNRIGNGGEGQTISSTPKACGVVFVIRAEGA